MAITELDQISLRVGPDGRCYLTPADVSTINAALQSLAYISPLLSEIVGHNAPRIRTGRNDAITIEGLLAYCDGSNWNPLAKAEKELLLYNGSGWDEACHPRIKIAEATDRDMTAASGDVAYTGVGFEPRLLFFLACVNGTAIMSIGFDYVDAKASLYDINGVTAGAYSVAATSSITLTEATGKSQTALVKTFDADGFTLTWTKTGTTSAGTADIRYLAIR